MAVDQDDQDLSAALSANVPEIYVNGVVNSLSNGDILSILNRNGRPVAMLNVSIPIAKAYAELLLDLVDSYETAAGYRVNAYVKAADTEDPVSSVQSAAEKVVGFARLPNGWNYGQGRPADDGAIVSALRILDDLHQGGFDAADAFPGNDGEVMVAVYQGRSCIEVLVNVDGSFDLTVEKGGATLVERDGLTEDELHLQLKDVVERPWNSSEGFSTPSTSIRGAGNSRAWRSRTPPRAASQSLRWIVSRRAEFRSAVTSQPFTRNG